MSHVQLSPTANLHNPYIKKKKKIRLPNKKPVRKKKPKPKLFLVSLRTGAPSRLVPETCH